MKGSLVLLALAIVILEKTAAQDCSSQLTCDACFAAGSVCSWCRGNNAGCFTAGSGYVCEEEEPSLSNSTATMDSTFGPGIQIRPQAVEFRLRPGETGSHNFTFQLGSGFPLDMYLLMDLGESMADDFANVRNNIAGMVTRLQNDVTTDLRIGFGTFVDKPIQTFVGNLQYLGTSSNSLLADGLRFNPHSFIHHVNFVDATTFETQFSSTFPFASGQVIGDDPNAGVPAQSSFRDNPLNSGLDALVQVATCSQSINWRPSNSTRRVVVFISDSGFHLTSEAWLAGVVQRQDGLCHLQPQPATALPGLSISRTIQNLANNGGFLGRLSDYQAAITQEYSSSSLVQNVLEANRIVPIFLIEQAQSNIYQQLVATLSQSNAVHFNLSSNSANLVDGSVLVEALRAVQGNVRLFPEVVDGVTVEVIASCGSPAEPNFCEGITAADMPTFQVRVTLSADACSVLDSYVLLPISDPFLGTTVLNISAICECPCSLNRMALGGGVCNDKGSMVCGVCDCEPNYFGTTCQCEGDRSSSCPVNPANNVMCSAPGIGFCNECNMCNCTSPSHYGPACECSNATCSRGGATSQLCSGNGDCVCNLCQCSPTHTGPACDCSADISTCREDVNSTAGALCNDRGSCECGSCSCSSGFTGAFCKFCTSTDNPSCTDACDSYESCVRCRYSVNENFQFTIKPRDDPECSVECNGIIGADGSSSTDTVSCSLNLGACSVQFSIPSSSQSINQVFINNSPQNCAYPFPAWAIAIIVFAAAVIIGIILLALLKLILYILDYMEYKNFEEDVNRTRFGENQNPLYRDPQTEHQNPLFKGKA